MKDDSRTINKFKTENDKLRKDLEILDDLKKENNYHKELVEKLQKEINNIPSLLEKKNLEYQILQINQKGIIDKLNEDNKKKEKELHDKYIKEENQIENKYEKIVKLCKDEVSNININKNIESRN